ncbi:MAG: HNH endonuclease [Salinibacterium sp.]|nr:MAG: HNH endonuclease [Salinibacterium sp.]
MPEREHLDRWNATRGKKGSKGPSTIDLIQREAKKYGATLETEGHGGVPPKLSLKVWRKFGYQCARCGTRKRLTLHHKGGVVDSERLDEMGHAMTADNLAVLCAKCHDFVHDQARKKGIDSQQVKPKGDGGPGLKPKEIERRRKQGRARPGL